MTTDHRRYLVEGDLRTPEDVLGWLDEYDPSEQLGDVRVELRVRLRRERRQAFKRGALEEWRKISCFLRRHELPFVAPGDALPSHIRSLAVLQFGSHSPDGHPWTSAGDVYHWLYGAFERALAFRAAARAKDSK